MFHLVKEFLRTDILKTLHSLSVNFETFQNISMRFYIEKIRLKIFKYS